MNNASKGRCVTVTPWGKGRSSPPGNSYDSLREEIAIGNSAVRNRGSARSVFRSGALKARPCTEESVLRYG